VCVYGLLGWHSRISRGIIILTVSEVTGYVSDGLGFHHPGSGPEDQKSHPDGERMRLKERWLEGEVMEGEMWKV